MGRGVAWTTEELAHLGRTWVATSENPILGIDKTSTRFFNAIFERFSQLAPECSNKKQYAGHGVRQVKAKMDHLTADCQKFRSALRFIRAYKPTGVTEDQVLSMTIAKHLGLRQTMSYDAKNFPHEQWVSNHAYKVLRNVPKFQEQAVESIPSPCS